MSGAAAAAYGRQSGEMHFRFRYYRNPSFTAWSGEGRVRHAVYQGMREDKAAEDVVMAVPDPEAIRRAVRPAGAVISAPATRSR